MVAAPRLNYGCRNRTASQLPLPLGEERGEGAQHSERVKASFDFCGNGSVVPPHYRSRFCNNVLELSVCRRVFSFGASNLPASNRNSSKLQKEYRDDLN